MSEQQNPAKVTENPSGGWYRVIKPFDGGDWVAFGGTVYHLTPEQAAAMNSDPTWPLAIPLTEADKLEIERVWTTLSALTGWPDGGPFDQPVVVVPKDWQD